MTKIILITIFIASLITCAILFIIHLKKLLANISASLKDPVNKNWSPKILTAFLFAILTAVIEITWLKKAYITDNFTGMELLLGFNFGYIVAAFGMKMAEKMQANKLDANKPKADDTTT